MEKDTFKTQILFRVINSGSFKGEVFAIMPYDIYDRKGNVTSYQHVGQHSGADYNHCIAISRPAKESEYNDLKNELEGLGYNIQVIQKRNHTKYINEYHKQK